MSIDLPGGFTIVYDGPVQDRVCLRCGRDLTQVGRDNPLGIAAYVVTTSGHTFCALCPNDPLAELRGAERQPEAPRAVFTPSPTKGPLYDPPPRPYQFVPVSHRRGPLPSRRPPLAAGRRRR